ncbi:hypothetical protein S245_052614 [Arachis hypogaea]
MAVQGTTPTGNYRVGIMKEENVINFEEKDIQGRRKRCERSLIGRLLADRQFLSGTIEAAMNSIWRQPERFKVINHGGNIFQFFFSEEKDVLQIEREDYGFAKIHP